MKGFLLTFAFIVFYCYGKSQTDCDCNFKTTLGIHYNYYKGMHGLGLEYGKTGDQSNFNIHMAADIFFPSKVSNGKYQFNNNALMNGWMYNKVGYRILRIPYQFSIYADIFGGLDMSTGFFYGAGVKILRPFNENAVSVEPIYIPGKKGGWNLQAAFHFKI